MFLRQDDMQVNTCMSSAPVVVYCASLIAMRWDEANGMTGVYGSPSDNERPCTRSPGVHLLSCEHRTRRVTRTEYSGAITALADNFNGARLSSPNRSRCQLD